MELRECGICGKKHEAVESQICEKCLKEIAGALLGRNTLSVKQAENLAFLLGNMDLERIGIGRIATENRHKIAALTKAFKNHSHSEGKVSLPYD